MSGLTDTTKFVLLIFVLRTTDDHHQVGCFTLNYPSFPQSVSDEFIEAPESNIVYDALQVTLAAQGGPTTPLSGRILHKNRFELWNRDRVASFNSTFVLCVNPQPSGGGEGLAFVLTKDPTVPPNSQGQWIGLVNASTNGSSQSSIVAVEFDTKKSFQQDLDVSLNSSNITIASASFITAMILYDGRAKMMNVSVFKENQTGLKAEMAIMPVPLDLTLYLPSKVYVGFSASTGLGSELNCVQKWYFNGDDIDSGIPLWVQVVIPVIILLLIMSSFLFGGYVFSRKKHPEGGHVSGLDDPTIQVIESGLGPKKIKLKDLKAATGNFNAKNELGRGGFGILYHGIWEGNEVAVKRTTNTPQGKQNLIAEVTTIGRLHHKNLVKLVGWCYESDELLLVYEFMPNGSLDRVIYKQHEKQIGKEKASFILTWERRQKIVCGVAQALDYLHNDCSRRVLHRDIKASNIMLDSEFNARLGDFGLARMFKLSEKTHHSTKEIAGTPGYMAPEIFLTGRTTAETDVFAFGVFTLVVACGRKPGVQNDQESKYMNIIDWVWELYKLEKMTEAIDPNLKGNFDKGQGECMLVLALACCHPNPYMRPSMRTALQVLTEGALPPLVPVEKPAFIWPATPPLFTQEEHFSGGILTTFSSLSGR
ncbi:hypothetical protein Cgig2_012174 [Carnegiea gigantea]|uniref:non-specific serine/threonine protein kinase n=1 Tax=Carnegiea gigantea TaxID=171969 RepID=A0A9Q1QQE5_9CARY|nr:hypothetical protein Cgig2_012174 [Carnegiea gigantea]